MAEKETIFSSKVKYRGIFKFKDLYQFCYDWIIEETDVNNLNEEKYSEKITGNTKEIEVEWKGEKELTDYFKFEIKVRFHILNMSEVEINENGRKVKTNNGDVKIDVKGNLIRDYKGKFETTAHKKFLRSIYEKWVISTRINEYEDYVTRECDTFLGQVKAWLDLEGKSRGI